MRPHASAAGTSMQIASWLAVACLLLVLASPAAAAGAEDPDLRAFVAQQREVRAEVEAGRGAFAAWPAERRAELLARQSELFELLGERERLQQLDKDEQAAALEAMSSIRALMPDGGERVVCRRTQRIGSKRIERVCRTESQLRREEEAARQHLERTRDRCLSGDGDGPACNVLGQPGRTP